MTKKFYVYIHRRKSDGRVFYVGKGTGKRALRTSGRNRYWKRVYNKHGRIVEILLHFEKENCAFSFEKAMIALYGKENLTNTTDGGEGVCGLVHSEEARKKMSGPRPNAKNWLKGRIPPDYLKEKWRKAKLGKKQSPEHAQKSRTNKVGVKIQDTSKFNLSKRKPVRNSKGEVFESAATAARAMSERFNVNASQGNISMCTNGKRKTAYGMKWFFA